MPVESLSYQTSLAITPIVVLELLEGANNKRHVESILKRLRPFNSVGLIDSDYALAINHMSSTRLSHNVGIMDCLMAAPAYRLQLPLVDTQYTPFHTVIRCIGGETVLI